MSAVPARDRQQLWLALVFNALIGNCDANGKNYSLLYHSPAPNLAPFYDLLSTAVYGELTTLLAMSIDGATHLGEIDWQAWLQLAGQVGFAPRFLEQRMLPFLGQVTEATMRLADEDEFVEAPVKELVGAIQVRAKRFQA